MIHALKTCASPGRGGHRPAKLASDKVYNCRESVSKLFHVGDPAGVVFTYNATHALNTAIFSSAQAGDRVVISGFEHNSVTRPLRAVGAETDIAGTVLFNEKDTIANFERKIPGAKLVVCTHISNVFGYVLPIGKISELCRSYSVPLIVDASQSAGVLNVDFNKLGCTFMAMPGHKSLFGPQGTGILLCTDKGKPILHGGAGTDSLSEKMPEYLPERLEAGTLNVCGISGLNAGVDYVRKTGTERISEYEKHLLQLLISKLSGINEIMIFASEEDNQSGILSFMPAKGDSESFAAALSQKGICVRAGLHCAPLAHKSAGTIAKGTVRISLSPFNTENEVLLAAREIKNIAQNH